LVSIYGHGYLLDPVARSSAWMVDPSFKNCCTYTDHMAMYCGGTQNQWNKNGCSFFYYFIFNLFFYLEGKCGICG